MQKKSLFFFSFPRRGNFSVGKVTKSREKSQIYLSFSQKPIRDSTTWPEGKVMKKQAKQFL